MINLKTLKEIFRASFQTGFRNPSTQDQYIGFNVGSAILLGSAPDNLTRYTETLPISATGQTYTGVSANTNIDGSIAYTNSFTAVSVATGNPSLFKKTVLNYKMIQGLRL